MRQSIERASFPRAFLEQRYFPSLDGLRTISIIPVVWHHATPRPYDGLLGRGPIGVDLFFAISGFLITSLLLRERLSSGRIDLKAFYVRRSCRIFPLYYLMLGLNLAFALFVRQDWEASRNFLQRWPAYATYTANWLGGSGNTGAILFAFAWSLCTEEQFYAFWAPILAFGRRLWLGAAFMGGWLLLDLLCEFGSLAALASEGSLPWRIVTSFATPIGFGALLAMAVHHPVIGRWLWRFLGARHAASVAAGLVLSLIIHPWAPTPVLHLGLAIWVVSCSVRPDHALAWLLDHGAMRSVGRVTYGIYLWHVPVIGAIRAAVPQLRDNALSIFALALPLSFLVAAASYRLFEQPFLRIGARYRGRSRVERPVYDAANTSDASASTVSSSAQ